MGRGGCSPVGLETGGVPPAGRGWRSPPPPPAGGLRMKLPARCAPCQAGNDGTAGRYGGRGRRGWRLTSVWCLARKKPPLGARPTRFRARSSLARATRRSPRPELDFGFVFDGLFMLSCSTRDCCSPPPHPRDESSPVSGSRARIYRASPPMGEGGLFSLHFSDNIVENVSMGARNRRCDCFHRPPRLRFATQLRPLVAGRE